MAGKLVHVGNDQGAALVRGGPAHALSHRDANARGLALERAQYELAVLQPVETGPVEAGQRVEDQRREVGGVGGEIALAGEERARLGVELGVELGFRAVMEGGCIEHSAGVGSAETILPPPRWG